MVDSAALSFSFLQGILAFFSPCAVALLPGYLSAFLTKNAEPDQRISMAQGLRSAIWYGSMSMLGIITVYGIAGVLLIIAAQLIKQYLVYVVITMGAAIIVLGVFMLLGRTLALNIHGSYRTFKNESANAFVFGTAYGLGALGCLFPLFLVVATTAVSAGMAGSAYIFAYAFGMAIFMLLFYIMALFAKQHMQRSLSTILPYVGPVGGSVVILAGVYIIWYQSALL
jgi:cytochrome c-type biogenesis protein